jgi:hypothetical protein
MTRVWFGQLLVAASTATAVGCGAGTKVAPVSGVVTLDGKPLANAHVAFQPRATGGTMNAGTGSYAVTDADGAYKLLMADTGKPGAVVGRHRVEINIRGETDDRDPRLRPPPKVLPAKYNRETELEFDVQPGGTGTATFNLSSK